MNILNLFYSFILKLSIVGILCIIAVKSIVKVILNHHRRYAARHWYHTAHIAHMIHLAYIVYIAYIVHVIHIIYIAHI